MDPIRRLLSYATMYVDLDMVPNFLKLWYHFFNKINFGIYIYIYDNELDTHVNTCLIISFSRENRILSLLVTFRQIIILKKNNNN